MDYVAPTAHAVGTSGIPFGGGAFTWGQHADGTYGWVAPDGRTWDAAGNPRPAPAPGQPQGVAAPVAPAVTAQTAVANPLVDWFTTHSGKDVNAYNFNRLKASTQKLTLAAGEAAGHDQGDLYEDIQRTLPKAIGPSRGYVAPLGSR